MSMQIISAVTKIITKIFITYSRRDFYWCHEMTNVERGPTELMFTCSTKYQHINNYLKQVYIFILRSFLVFILTTSSSGFMYLKSFF